MKKQFQQEKIPGTGGNFLKLPSQRTDARVREFCSKRQSVGGGGGRGKYCKFCLHTKNPILLPPPFLPRDGVGSLLLHKRGKGTGLSVLCVCPHVLFFIPSVASPKAEVDSFFDCGPHFMHFVQKSHFMSEIFVKIQIF